MSSIFTATLVWSAR